MFLKLIKNVDAGELLKPYCSRDQPWRINRHSPSAAALYSDHLLVEAIYSVIMFTMDTRKREIVYECFKVFSFCNCAPIITGVV